MSAPISLHRVGSPLVETRVVFGFDHRGLSHSNESRDVGTENRKKNACVVCVPEASWDGAPSRVVRRRNLEHGYLRRTRKLDGDRWPPAGNYARTRMDKIGLVEIVVNDEPCSKRSIRDCVCQREEKSGHRLILVLDRGTVVPFRLNWKYCRYKKTTESQARDPSERRLEDFGCREHAASLRQSRCDWLPATGVG